MITRMATPVGGRLASALRATYEAAGLTQQELAEAIGVDQTTVSTWARGMSRTPLDVLPEIERAVGVPVGTILRRAGYVEDVVGASVEQALLADGSIMEDDRQALLRNYRAAQARAVQSGAAGEFRINPDDPDEVEIWADDRLSKEQRWQVVLRIRRIKARDEDPAADVG